MFSLRDMQAHIIPTVPLMAPPYTRQQSADTNVVANPDPKHEMAVPTRPINNTIFLPKEVESAALPHSIAVATWVPVKQPCNTPAWYEIVLSGKLTLKLFSW
jgi:hypothetical protein